MWANNLHSHLFLLKEIKMGLTLEEKLKICQSTIDGLQKENEALKEENATLKKSLSIFSKDGQIEITNYIAQFNDLIDELHKARTESLDELKKTNEEMKVTRRKLDKLTGKTKFQLWLAGVRDKLDE